MRPDEQALHNHVASAKRRIRAQTVATLTSLWDVTIGDRTLPPDVAEDAFVTEVAQQSAAAVVATGQLMDGYVDTWLDLVDVDPSGRAAADAVPDLDDLPGRVRNGVDLDEAFRRPFRAASRAQADGTPRDLALTEARARQVKIAETHVQQAHRLRAHDRFNSEPSIVGYRRTLTGAENCGLCIVASTRRYKASTLNPIHPGCDCGVAALAAGTGINRSGVRGTGGIVAEIPNLDAAKQVLRDAGVNPGSRGELANIKITDGMLDQLDGVTQRPHSELGPILVVAKHRTQPTLGRQTNFRRLTPTKSA